MNTISIKFDNEVNTENKDISKKYVSEKFAYRVGTAGFAIFIVTGLIFFFVAVSK